MTKETNVAKIVDSLASTASNEGASLVEYTAPFIGSYGRNLSTKLLDVPTLYDGLNSYESQARGWPSTSTPSTMNTYVASISDTSSLLSSYLLNTADLGPAVIPAGLFRVDSGVVIDYTVGGGNTIPHPAFPSNRREIQGSGKEKTFFAVDNSAVGSIFLKLLGSPVINGTNGSSFNTCIGGFSVSDYSATTWNKFGIACYNAAYLKFKDIAMWELETGLYTNSCLYMDISDCQFRECKDGAIFTWDETALAANISGYTNGNGSLPNANLIQHVSFNANQHSGLSGIIGAANTFQNCHFEGNGTTGTTGAAGYGGCLLQIMAANGTAQVTFDECYFEGNIGEADCKIYTSDADDQTVVFKNCVFNRNTSAANYTTANLSIVNTSSGTLRVILIGCSFLHTGGTMSSSTPYISTSGKVIIEDIGSSFSGGNGATTTTPVSTNQKTHYSLSMPIVGRIDTTGAWIGSTIPGLNVGKAGVGQYSVSYNYFGATNMDYQVMATPVYDFTNITQTQKISCHVAYTTNYAFDVYVVDTTTQTLVDNAVSVAIFMTKG